MLGLSEGVVCTASVLMGAVHPEDRARLATMMSRCLAEGDPVELVHRLAVPGRPTQRVHVRAEQATGSHYRATRGGDSA